MIVDDKYNYVCTTESDIWQHLPTLHRYARSCQHITEMGVRAVVSTWAFMAARPQKLISMDIEWHNNVLEAQKAATECGVTFEFVLGDVLKTDIAPTDMLFIDTWHHYKQLKQELSRHAHKARKYMAFHDTEIFGIKGQDGDKGLLPALNEFLEWHSEWSIAEVFTNNNGLHVLKRS